MTFDDYFDDTYFGEKLTVLRYEYIDDPGYIQKPERYLSINSYSLALIDKVKTVFKENGWEGDGEIGLIYLPPFFYIPSPDDVVDHNFGTFIWHVKQNNNGTSFLGFYPDGLKSVAKGSSLTLQNENFFDVGK